VSVSCDIPMPIRTAIAVVNADGQYAYLNRVDGLYWFYTTAIGPPSDPWYTTKATPGVIAWKMSEVRNYARDLVNAGRVTVTHDRGVPHATKS